MEEIWHLPLEKVAGRAAKKLAQKLDLHTVRDLLYFFPRKYHQKGQLTAFADLVEGEEQSILAVILDSNTRRTASGKFMLTLTLSDGVDRMQAVFWAKNQHILNWQASRMRPGQTMLFSGKPGSYQGRKQLSHPSAYAIDNQDSEFEEPDLNQVDAMIDRPEAIYPAKAGLPTWTIARTIHTVLAQLGEIEDPLSPEIRAEYGLVELKTALQQIHQPQSVEDYQQARARFCFEEALYLQIALAQIRAEQEKQGAPALVPANSKTALSTLPETVQESLPFTLTSSQLDSLQQINQALASTIPANILLQGDVGAGKTVVALLSMLRAIACGYQSVLLVPTEVLADQHFASIEKILGNYPQQSGFKLWKLNGQMPMTQRRQILAELAGGTPGIVVGTHALLSEQVQIPACALLVIDEQHRFGVEQRARLRQVNMYGELPHLMVMTATPIPRTVAMTSFGDMETVLLKGLPQGRKEVGTFLVHTSNLALKQRTWQRAQEEISQGGRVFVVCPSIEANETASETEGSTAKVENRAVLSTKVEKLGSEKSGAEKLGVDKPSLPEIASVTETAQMLAEEPALPGAKIAILHSRMPGEEKTQVMEQFRLGKIDILVATTVIEVGVDIPDATMMVIIDADRFGLSQLHQLRGRIGRGSRAGVCICWSGVEKGSLAAERLLAFRDTKDGFELAQKDLELRDTGNILGASQSGHRQGTKLLDLKKDGEIIAQARQLARSIIKQDAELEQHPKLRAALQMALSGEENTYLSRN